MFFLVEMLREHRKQVM